MSVKVYSDDQDSLYHPAKIALAPFAGLAEFGKDHARHTALHWRAFAEGPLHLFLQICIFSRDRLCKLASPHSRHVFQRH